MASVAIVVIDLYRRVDVLEANQASSSLRLAPASSPARPRRKERTATYTPIAIKYDNVFNILTSRGLITPLPLKEVPVAVKMSAHWRKSAYCRYHQIKGHSIEGCFAFKEIVQQFIDRGESFTKDDIPLSNPQDTFINGLWDSYDTDRRAPQ